MSSTDERAALERRWLVLTRDILPCMAPAQAWPIRLNHCFMRVCLDAVMGAPWTEALTRPAIRHMSEAQLVAAIGVAEEIAAHPDRLGPLNAASLEGRAAHRRAASIRGSDLVA